jgi:hypothetical protein
MEKRLEDLISQADKLLEAASEERKRASFQQVSAEVEPAESSRFNQKYPDRRLAFYQRYPRISGFFTTIFIILICVIIYMKITASHPIGSYRVVVGSVKSTRFTSARTAYGGHVEVAEVVLPDGKVITARVDSGAIIAIGTDVPVRIYEDGAIRLVHPL